MDTQQLMQQACMRLSIDSLNAMQQATIDTCQSAQDVILLAPTGSGKTLAYLIPLLSRVTPQSGRVQAVIIVPTRELALQVEQVARTISSGCRIVCCYGGHSFRDEARSLESIADIVIGTPGRLLDHVRRERLSLDEVETLILDEFDKSLELGFHNEMRSLIRPLKKLTLRILTSATDIGELPDFVIMPQAVRLYYIDNTRL